MTIQKNNDDITVKLPSDIGFPLRITISNVQAFLSKKNKHLFSSASNSIYLLLYEYRIYVGHTNGPADRLCDHIRETQGINKIIVLDSNSSTRIITDGACHTLENSLFIYLGNNIFKYKLKNKKCPEKPMINGEEQTTHDVIFNYLKSHFIELIPDLYNDLFCHENDTIEALECRSGQNLTVYIDNNYRYDISSEKYDDFIGINILKIKDSESCMIMKDSKSKYYEIDKRAQMIPYYKSRQTMENLNCVSKISQSSHEFWDNASDALTFNNNIIFPSIDFICQFLCGQYDTKIFNQLQIKSNIA